MENVTVNYNELKKFIDKKWLKAAQMQDWHGSQTDIWKGEVRVYNELREWLEKNKNE